jgi:hypothetical protein
MNELCLHQNLYANLNQIAGWPIKEVTYNVSESITGYAVEVLSVCGKHA